MKPLDNYTHNESLTACGSTRGKEDQLDHVAERQRLKMGALTGVQVTLSVITRMSPV